MYSSSAWKSISKKKKELVIIMAKRKAIEKINKNKQLNQSV